MSTLSKDIFPQLLKTLQNKLDHGGQASQNLISGFAKTGLYPFNPSRPKQRLPPEEITNDKTPSLVSDSVLAILKEMRTGGPESTETKKPRRKRLAVEPGKSISADDLLASSSKRQPDDITNSSSDEEIISVGSVDSDHLPLITYVGKENITPSKLTDEEMLPIGQWVVVQYFGKKRSHFIGQIISKIKENDLWIFKINFLKKSNKTDRFLKPTAEDVDTVSLDMIVKKLNDPKIEGTDRRQFFTFIENLNAFDFS